MDRESVIKKFQLGLYVQEIFLLEDEDIHKESRLPFFADGYPGILYQQTKHGAYLFPRNKKLSKLFLYGQTIHPIEIAIKGSYRLIIFQLYPSATRILLGIDPKKLNDDCYDLSLADAKSAAGAIQKMSAESNTSKQMEILAKFIAGLIKKNVTEQEEKLQLAINYIISNNGKVLVKDLVKNLHMTERTLQRRFIEYIGISPKQFAKIVRFKSSFSDISKDGFSKLTEIVYENGYADQSHFIRDFKKFTGKQPSRFKKAK